MKTENKLKKKSSLLLSANVLKNVKAILAEQNMTKKDLAEAIGAPLATVYGILDDPGRVKVNHVEIFARVLGVDAAELFRAPRSTR